MLERIDVALLPRDAAGFEADTFVVVDLFRATTTIATAFGRGLARLTVADDLARARELAAGRGALLMGEVHGRAPDGFDFGNSPREVGAADLGGREAVMFTTNGTAAICAVAGRGTVLAGALANAGAIAACLAAQARRAVVVCAGNGRGTAFSLEDFAGAGAIVRSVLANAPGVALGDAARAAAALPVDLAVAAEHAESLRRIGLEADIPHALRVDTETCVPRVVAAGEGHATLEDAAR